MGQQAVLQVIAKMALSDGKIALDERQFLQEMLRTNETSMVDALLDEADQNSLESLIKSVVKYEDRFFIALRAYSMAHIDEHFDAQEEAMFNKLIDLLDVLPEDRVLIEKTEAAMSAVEPEPFDPRLEEFYRNSSFSAE